ncbi:MAG: hypothetical protein ABJB16_06965 [Saprospiraceae bacterium]
MKKTNTSYHLFILAALSVLVIFVISCSEPNISPIGNLLDKQEKISVRSDGPLSTDIVKEKVAVRDNIPLSEILTCIYFGQTPEGYWEYHLTTLYDGPKIYFVTQIIGDVNDGF